jgi:predicted O-methyltransferase YrrM
MRYRPIFCHTEIEGFLHSREACALYDLARGLRRGAVVVEIGSWLGKSSVTIAKGLQRVPGARLFCIDPFDGAGDSASVEYYHASMAQRGSPKERFLGNAERCGVRSIIYPLEGRSFDFAAGWKTPIDLLFIDGDHSFAAAERDYLDWNGHVRNGGYVAFHDAWLEPPRTGCFHRGPGEVVKKFVLPDRQWHCLPTAHSLFVARKDAVQ